MKKSILFIFTICFIILSVNVVKGQSGNLFPSISFEESLNHGSSKKRFEIDKSEGYPEDLKSSNTFFIEISKEDIKQNYSVIFGPFYKGINKNIKNKMRKKYPYEFEVFNNGFLSKGKEHFLKNGFKYRLLINSTWYEVRSDRSQNNNPIWKQNFAIVIQNIETGMIYGMKKWYWYINYVDKFVNSIK